MDTTSSSDSLDSGHGVRSLQDLATQAVLQHARDEDITSLPEHLKNAIINEQRTELHALRKELRAIKRSVKPVDLKHALDMHEYVETGDNHIRRNKEAYKVEAALVTSLWRIVNGRKVPNHRCSDGKTVYREEGSRVTRDGEIISIHDAGFESSSAYDYQVYQLLAWSSLVYRLTLLYDKVLCLRQTIALVFDKDESWVKFYLTEEGEMLWYAVCSDEAYQAFKALFRLLLSDRMPVPYRS